MNTGICCRLKCFSKFRMCLPIWFKIPYILHLDHQKKIRLIAVSCCMHQLTEMLDPPFCRCVRKTHDIIFFQSDAFYLDKSLSLPGFHIQVKTRIFVYGFRPDQSHISKKISLFNPFFYNLIRNLRVHIDHSTALFYGNQVPPCLSGRIIAFLNINICSRPKKLGASSCIFHMNRFLFPV